MTSTCCRSLASWKGWNKLRVYLFGRVNNCLKGMFHLLNKTWKTINGISMTLVSFTLSIIDNLEGNEGHVDMKLSIPDDV